MNKGGVRGAAPKRNLQGGNLRGGNGPSTQSIQEIPMEMLIIRMSGRPLYNLQFHKWRGLGAQPLKETYREGEFEEGRERTLNSICPRNTHGNADKPLYLTLGLQKLI